MAPVQDVTISYIDDEPSCAGVRDLLLKVWRTRGLNRALNLASAYAPEPTRSWIEQERARVRKIELEARIRQRPRLVPESDLRALLAAGLRWITERHGRESLGEYLEFGVYNGSSLLCMYHELVATGLDHVRLFGFDSFEGFPPEAAQEDRGRWRPGRCHAPLEFTRAVLDAEGVGWDRVTLVPGWFRDTLTSRTRATHGLRKASVIMIDCDLYSSTKQALAFSAPLIRDHALVLFDEYYPKGLEHEHLGEKKAFHEFLLESNCFEAVPFGRYAPRTQTFLVSRRR